MTTPRDDLSALRQLARRYPGPDAIWLEIAVLRAELTLPKGTVHVLSDVHGEYGKLRHVINNASGTLRPRIERTLGDRLGPVEMREFLALVFYPAEFLDSIADRLAGADGRKAFARKVMPELLELVRRIARPDRLPAAIAAVPAPYDGLVRDLVQSPDIINLTFI